MPHGCIKLNFVLSAGSQCRKPTNLDSNTHTHILVGENLYARHKQTLTAMQQHDPHTRIYIYIYDARLVFSMRLRSACRHSTHMLDTYTYHMCVMFMNVKCISYGLYTMDAINHEEMGASCAHTPIKEKKTHEFVEVTNNNNENIPNKICSSKDGKYKVANKLLYGWFASTYVPYAIQRHRTRAKKKRTMGANADEWVQFTQRIAAAAATTTKKRKVISYLYEICMQFSPRQLVYRSFCIFIVIALIIVACLPPEKRRQRRQRWRRPSTHCHIGSTMAHCTRSHASAQTSTHVSLYYTIYANALHTIADAFF